MLFVVIALLENSRLSSAKAIHVAGHFKQTQWHAWVEMAINIIVSLIGVLAWGIYGVLIGTIAALLFRANAMIIYANKKSCTAARGRPIAAGWSTWRCSLR